MSRLHHPLPGVINAPQMRLVNRSAIMALIRQDSPIARSEIGRRLGLSLPTVMRIVDELIEDDMVRPTGETEWSSGRRRELLEYHKDGQVVIGVDLGETRVLAALTNIGGEILQEIRLDRSGMTCEERFDLLVGLIRQLLEAPRKEGQRLCGISIGVSGTRVSQRDDPLRQRLEAAFHLPVFVDSAVHLMALAECWFGAGRGVDNLVLLSIGDDLRAGIIIDGALYRGLGEQAGQVSLITANQIGGRCSVLSGSGMLERARRLLEGQYPAERLSSLTLEDVFTAARWGEPWALKIMDEAVDTLSGSVLNLAAMLDPQLLVLSSEFAFPADVLVPRVLERLKGALPYAPCLAVSTLGSRGVILGAVPLIAYHTSDHFLIRKLS